MILRARYAAAGVAPLVLSASLAVGQEPAPTPIVPTWVEREIPSHIENVKGVLCSTLERAGLTIEEEAGGVEGEIVTAWLEFEREDFGRNVALDAPLITRLYPFIQPIRLHKGRYRLRARIEPREQATRIALQAEILARAFNRMTYEHVEVERLSNGIIETTFHARIEEALIRPDDPR